MNIAFYVNEMNYRGVANSTYKYAFYNEKILKNNSIIFFNKRNRSNKKDVIDRFKKEFTIIGVSEFSKINNYKEKMRLKARQRAELSFDNMVYLDSFNCFLGSLDSVS
mgnify:CR=1 FL=1